MIYKTEEELLEKARAAEGISFGELDKKGRLSNSKSKGGLGQIIEESYFGYKVNSSAEPDFQELGIELKVTPFKKNTKGKITAKERLVLNIINYMKEVNYTFDTSSFWNKNSKLLLMFYQWLPGIDRSDLKVTKSILFTFSDSDLQIIKKDWETIVNKVRDGKAHELSEGDTNYLGACTKGANKSSLREQPFSKELAMQRAFSLKQSYMTSLVRKFIKNEELVSIAKSDELIKKSFEEILYDRFNPYIGLTVFEISQRLGIKYNQKAKSFIPLMISSLLGIKGTKLNDIEEFSKANIQFKTIRLEPNNKPKESMSFKNINFNQWFTESWEESEIRETFMSTKFLFVIFKYKETEKQNTERELYFEGIKLWNMPIKTIDTEIKEVWEETNRLIGEEVRIEHKKRGNILIETNNFPKKDFNGVAHIRPKGRNGKDKVILPNGQFVTKQCFWLNNNYIAEILDGNN